MTALIPWLIEGTGYEVKHKRSKQRCQNLCWKVHDPAQSFVLRLNAMHELRNQYLHLVSSTKRSK